LTPKLDLDANKNDIEYIGTKANTLVDSEKIEKCDDKLEKISDTMVDIESERDGNTQHKEKEQPKP